MTKIKKPNKRLVKLGDIITLRNGDIISIAYHTNACRDICYFVDYDGVRNMNFCKGTSIIKKEVPNFELYSRSTTYKQCFLQTGWHFVKIGNKKEGI